MRTLGGAGPSEVNDTDLASWQSAFARWLNTTSPSTPSAPTTIGAPSGIDLEIAASWRQTQQLLDARIRDGAFGENDNGAGVLSELGADASAPYKALGRISDQRLPQFAGLEEGLKFLSA